MKNMREYKTEAKELGVTFYEAKTIQDLKQRGKI